MRHGAGSEMKAHVKNEERQDLLNVLFACWLAGLLRARLLAYGLWIMDYGLRKVGYGLLILYLWTIDCGL
jgi:hypothetical protein